MVQAIRKLLRLQLYWPRIRPLAFDQFLRPRQQQLHPTRERLGDCHRRPDLQCWSRKTAPRPSSASASARPVPEFDDGDSDDEDDVKLVEQNDDGESVEEGEEEVNAEDPDIPADDNSSGNQEILQALNKLTEAVTTLANRNTRSRSPLRRKRTSDAPKARSRSPTNRPMRSRSPPRSTKPKSLAKARARSERPKSPAASKPLSPHTPDHPPPPDRPPPRLLNKSKYEESQRTDLEDELWVLLTRDGAPKVDQADPELLHALVGAATNWSNRDRVLWLVNRDPPAKDQQWYGIRVDVKIRGGVYTSAILIRLDDEVGMAQDSVCSKA